VIKVGGGKFLVSLFTFEQTIDCSREQKWERVAKSNEKIKGCEESAWMI